MLALIMMYTFTAFVVYTYAEELKTALIWPYTLIASLFKRFTDSSERFNGRINLPPAVELPLIIVLSIASLAMAGGLLELFIVYFFTMFVVNSNIQNLPASLLWPFMVIRFVFVKLFALIGLRKSG